jgi:hypothetical protein
VDIEQINIVCLELFEAVLQRDAHTLNSCPHSSIGGAPYHGGLKKSGGILCGDTGRCEVGVGLQRDRLTAGDGIVHKLVPIFASLHPFSQPDFRLSV